MLKIYTIPVSLYCAKLRILLRHKNLDWEEIPPPGGYGSEEYNTLVPAGNLPALDHSGLVLGDSEAIAEYLNEKFPEPEMLPDNMEERARTRERSRFHDTRLEPAVRALFPHIDPAKRDRKFVAGQWDIVQKRLNQAETLMPTASPQLTLGDCGYPITCTWIAELATHFDLQPCIPGPVRDHLARLSEHAAVTAELDVYHPRLVKWLAEQ